MRIFVAGATGAVGGRLVPLLLEHGHDVVGMTRSPGKAQALRALGAEPAIADGLDRDAVMRAVADAQPDAIVHQMTALTDLSDMRHFDRAFATTNALRTSGTDNLLAAARATGVRRMVAQSFAGWTYAREGGPVKTEDDPLDPDPPQAMREVLDAIRRLEATVIGAGDVEGVALRYGGFYGPGTSIAPDGEHWKLIHARRFPIVGGGGGIWSFAHIDDVAGATVAAIESSATGIFNVVDDEPAPASVWLPALAEAIGAPAPRRVPAWLGRLVGGEAVVSMMTSIRGASNAKAKRELGWTPRHSTWRDGFRELATPATARAA